MWINRKTGGFTLVELLVVISIIGVLLGIILAALGPVLAKGKKTACLSDLTQIKTAVNLYERDCRDFPPSSLMELGLKQENLINSGIESLVVCLSSTSHNAVYFTFKDDKLDNTDKDTSPVPLKKLAGSSFLVDSLWEFIDPWGTPLVYFHHRNLLPDNKATYMVRGAKTAVSPNLMRTKTGKIRGYSEYQLFSCGKDATPGTADDLMSE